MSELVGISQSNQMKLIQKASFLLTVFLCVFIPLRSVLELYTVSYVKMVPDILILGLLLWYAITIRFRFKFVLQDWIFLGFIALAFVSSIFINHVGISPFIFQVRSIGIYYIFYFVLRNLQFGKKEFVSIVMVLQIMAIFLFAFAVVEKIASKTLLFPSSIADGIIYASNFSRVYSLFFNPNTYAMFLDFVIFLSIFRRISYGVKTHSVVYGILVASVLLSMSRAGIIILVAGTILISIYMMAKYRKAIPYKKLILSSLIVLVIGSAGYLGVQAGANVYHEMVLKDSKQDSDKISSSMQIGAGDRFDNTLTEEELEQSGNDGRIYSLTKGLEIVSDYPIFGTGFGTFGSAASMNFKPAIAEKYDLPFPFYADNEYIKVLVENGILGAIVFVGFLVAVLYYYRKDLVKLFMCLVFGWFGLFYNVFEVQIGAMLFWMTLSLVKFPTFQESSKIDKRM